LTLRLSYLLCIGRWCLHTWRKPVFLDNPRVMSHQVHRISCVVRTTSTPIRRSRYTTTHQVFNFTHLPAQISYLLLFSVVQEPTYNIYLNVEGWRFAVILHMRRSKYKNKTNATTDPRPRPHSYRWLCLSAPQGSLPLHLQDHS